MAIHIHLPARQVVKTKDSQKPYVSSTKEGWEVLGNKGQLIKSFPKTDAGREAAQKYLKENFEKLTQDALSLTEAERELKNELRLIEVFKKQGKSVPASMLGRQKMLEDEVERWKAKTGDAMASAKIKAHPQFTQPDYDYLRGKGWSDAEILKRWDEEKTKGQAPNKVNKNAKPDQPGYPSADADETKYVLKRDTAVDIPDWKGKKLVTGEAIINQGTVFYKKGSGFVPWMRKNMSPITWLKPSDFVVHDFDSKK